MKKQTMKMMLSVAGCVFLLGAVCVGVGKAMGANFDIVSEMEVLDLKSELKDTHSRDVFGENYDVIKSLDITSTCGVISIKDDDHKNEVSLYGFEPEDYTLENNDGHLTLNVQKQTCSSDESIQIEVREDSLLESVKITQGAGNISIKDLQTQALLVDSQTGSIRLDDVTSAQTSLITQTGKVHAEGDFTGETQIQVTTGDIEVDLDRPSSTYGYTLENETGKIIVNDRRVSDHNGQVSGGTENASNRLTARTETGTIELDFDED